MKAKQPRKTEHCTLTYTGLRMLLLILASRGRAWHRLHRGCRRRLLRHGTGLYLLLLLLLMQLLLLSLLCAGGGADAGDAVRSCSPCPVCHCWRCCYGNRESHRHATFRKINLEHVLDLYREHVLDLYRILSDSD